MLKYRRITAADDEAIAKIVRTNLEKLHLNIPGTAYYDPELDHLSEYYNSSPVKRCYFIALDEAEQVIGGVGIAEFNGIEDCAEMQKLYLDDSAKGKGYSIEMVSIAEKWAKDAGYKQLYLETHSNLKVAIKLYERLGFKQIEKPSCVLHGTMDHFYLKRLSDSMKIRKATPDDIDAIETIYENIHGEEEKGTTTIGWIRNVYPTRKTAEDALARKDLFVMENEGRIVAVAVINQIQVAEYKYAAWKHDAGDNEIMVLHGLAVDPHQKSKGYGRAFVTFYEKYAKKHGCPALRMDTNERNERARALYQRLGYEEVDIVDCTFNGIPDVRLVCLEKYLQ